MVVQRAAAQLGDVAAQGYDLGPSRSVAGVTDIGAPVFGDSGFAVGAITVPFIQRPHDPISIEKATQVVVREAALMSQDLAVGMPVTITQKPI